MGGSSGAGYNFEGFPSICTFPPPRFSETPGGRLPQGGISPGFSFFLFLFFQKEKMRGEKGQGVDVYFIVKVLSGGNPKFHVRFCKKIKGEAIKRAKGREEGGGGKGATLI